MFKILNSEKFAAEVTPRSLKIINSVPIEAAYTASY